MKNFSTNSETAVSFHYLKTIGLAGAITGNNDSKDIGNSSLR